MDLPIVGKEVRGDGKVEIQAKLTNFDVEEGFPEMHKGKGWAGIGYHFVVRKDGKIERGRPEWAKSRARTQFKFNRYSLVRRF